MNIERHSLEQQVKDDRLITAVSLLAGGASCFDQILWDPEQKVLTFRRSGMQDFVQLYVDSRLAEPHDEHAYDRNGHCTPGSRLLWDTGSEIDDEH